MSMQNTRTGRFADDFMVKLYDGSATVGDLMSHAQEIIVDAETTWGTAVTEPVRLLMMLVDCLSDGEVPVHQHDKLRELEAELRG